MMKHPTVVRTIERVDPGVVDRLVAQGVSTVSEAMGRTGLLDTAIHPIQTGRSIGGSAITVLCQPGDNLMIHVAIELCQPGHVLVVTTTSPSVDGMFGELLATSLMARGVHALVIDAGVRDVAALRELGFAVWTRAVSAQGTVKNTPGSVNVPVVIAGRSVHPGDVVIADDDGVVIVPRTQAAAVAGAAEARSQNEAVTRQRLAAGEVSLDLFALRERVASMGIRYVETERDL
jgi:4-hydroxy-4-methyl-2-oxoglutarate aldolase